MAADFVVSRRRKTYLLAPPQPVGAQSTARLEAYDLIGGGHAKLA
jgi:hypothetical protein